MQTTDKEKKNEKCEGKDVWGNMTKMQLIRILEGSIRKKMTRQQPKRKQLRIIEDSISQIQEAKKKLKMQLKQIKMPSLLMELSFI